MSKENTDVEIIEDEIIEDDPVNVKDAIVETVEDKVEKPFNYVKERVSRAKRQTEESILSQLGVKSVDEAKSALEEIQDIKQALAEKEQQVVEANKRSQLLSVLESKDVFDSEALLHYVDLDKVELTEDGQLVDADGIVSSLQATKPNFFGVRKTVTDSHNKGGVSKPLTALDKQKQGDKVGAISDYLKDIMK